MPKARIENFICQAALAGGMGFIPLAPQPLLLQREILFAQQGPIQPGKPVDIERSQALPHGRVSPTKTEIGISKIQREQSEASPFSVERFPLPQDAVDVKLLKDEKNQLTVSYLDEQKLLHVVRPATGEEIVIPEISGYDIAVNSKPASGEPTTLVALAYQKTDQPNSQLAIMDLNKLILWVWHDDGNVTNPTIRMVEDQTDGSKQPVIAYRETISGSTDLYVQISGSPTISGGWYLYNLGSSLGDHGLKLAADGKDFALAAKQDGPNGSESSVAVERMVYHGEGRLLLTDSPDIVSLPGEQRIGNFAVVATPNQGAVLSLVASSFEGITSRWLVLVGADGENKVISHALPNQGEFISPDEKVAITTNNDGERVAVYVAPDGKMISSHNKGMTFYELPMPALTVTDRVNTGELSLVANPDGQTLTLGQQLKSATAPEVNEAAWEELPAKLNHLYLPAVQHDPDR